jgi:GcrA cell cycle regulator
MSRGDNWTPDRIELLKKRWAEGATATEIEAEMAGSGITRSAVLGKARRMKLAERVPRAHPNSVRKTRDRRRTQVAAPPTTTPKPKELPKPVETPAPIPAPTTEPTSLVELTSQQCRYVVDDSRVPALCCGAPTIGGSWCAFHTRIVFTPAALRQRAPSTRRNRPIVMTYERSVRAW